MVVVGREREHGRELPWLSARHLPSARVVGVSVRPQPENILLCGRVAKVADFGLSRFVHGHAEASIAPAARDASPPFTTISEQRALDNFQPHMTGQTGSCRYMAPEVWARRMYDHRADVFSFGILAWEVFARKRAYADKLLTMDMVAAAVERSPAFRPPLPKTWPEELSNIVSGCWHEDPAMRPTFWEVARRADVLVRAVESAESETGTGSETEELGLAVLRALAPRASSCCICQ